jgi:hypothetical protein
MKTTSNGKISKVEYLKGNLDCSKILNLSLGDQTEGENC